MKKTIVTLMTLAAMTNAPAATQSFDFKDPKGVNNAIFKLDAPLEAINGSANGVSGIVKFDPENPAGTTGTIQVAARTMHVPNPTMKEHLHSGQWLDVAKFPEITFEAKQLKNVRTEGNVTSAVADGTLSIKGVSRNISVPVKLTFLKDKLSHRVPNLKGDLLVIRSTFTVKRSDFGINPAAPQETVSDEIELTLSLAGASAR